MRSKALAQNAPIHWERNRGRNGHDVPSEVALDQSCASINIELVQNSLGRRRNGSALVPQVAGPVMLARFVPGQDVRQSELHLTATDGLWYRVVGAAPMVNYTTPDPNTVTAFHASWAALNGKLYWAYPSAVNRLHVYDPDFSTAAMRRTGLGMPPIAPTVFELNPPAGTYPAIIRYYRLRYAVLNADGTLQRESEASPVSPALPSGTAQSLLIQRGDGAAVPGDGETHWRVEASADNLTFFILSGWLAMSVDTYADTALPSTYASLTAAPPAGTRSPFPSVKFLCADQDRLLGFGVWPVATEAGGGGVPQHPGRVYFTPVLDSTDQDDDERIDWGADSPGYIDVGRNRGYEDRALAGPLDGQFLAFQSLGIHLLVGTGVAVAPFRRVTLTDKLGAVSHTSTFIGEDETGKPCCYFLDPSRGPYRYGRNGLEWLGYDVQDAWDGINLEGFVVAHGYYDTNMRAAVWFWNIGPGSNTPTRCFIFCVDSGRSAEEGVRGGWVEWDNTRWVKAVSSYSSLMFAETLGAPNSIRETGHVAATELYKINLRGTSDDAGSPFQASIVSPAFQPPPKHVNKTAGVSYLQTSAHTGTKIRQTLVRNFGQLGSGQVKEAVLTPDVIGAVAATRKLSAFKELAVTDAYALQVVLGDPGPQAVTHAEAQGTAWTLDDWVLTFESGDER